MATGNDSSSSSPLGKRPQVDTLDALLGKRLDVLDDGFVRVVDYMGDDGAIVQAARVSYGVGTRKARDDRALIRYLMRHRHTTPFEMCEIKLHVRVPMDTWRQWIRHRTASVNEYSTRYSVAIDAAQRTAPGAWRKQTSDNRQGSQGLFREIEGAELTLEEQQLQQHARAVYNARVERGVAREQARKDLPLSTYTEAYWKVDLHNLLHFLDLRMEAHAQEEIRAYATLIGEQIVAAWVPLAWKAFVDYRFGALALTALEIELLAALNAGGVQAALAVANDKGLLARDEDGALKRNRERAECEEKFRRLGHEIPWQ